MKTITQTPKLLHFLEADDKRNTLRVQLRIWKISNRTEIIVRVENQRRKGETLWKEGEKNLSNGEVSTKVLNFLQELKIIENPENWGYSAQRTNEIQAMDEYEDK